MPITPYEVSLQPREGANQNVIAFYKDWLTEAIKADLAPKRQPFVTILKNATKDFNKASAIRSHNAFLGRSIYLVGKRSYDKRGTVGTHHFETLYHATTLQEVTEALRREGYTIFAIENTPEYAPVSLWYYEGLPAKSAFLYGEENAGLSPEEVALCDEVLFLEALGSVRSINVACAATVIMAEYTRQHRRSASHP